MWASSMHSNHWGKHYFKVHSMVIMVMMWWPRDTWSRYFNMGRGMTEPPKDMDNRWGDGRPSGGRPRHIGDGPSSYTEEAGVGIHGQGIHNMTAPHFGALAPWVEKYKVMLCGPPRKKKVWGKKNNTRNHTSQTKCESIKLHSYCTTCFTLWYHACFTL